MVLVGPNSGEVIQKALDIAMELLEAIVFEAES